MKMKKLLLILTAGVVINLNAGMVSAITGENVSKDDYKNKDRGIIVDQDVDGDGIIDSKDDCLETKPCQAEGCQKEEKKVVILDTDKDGVLDNIDECKSTPLGYKVDSIGCSILVDLSVQFDTNKYNIKTNYTEKLDEFINFMKKHENFKAVIEGHTDSVGTEKNNQILSDNRAKSVREYIIENGIEESRLESVGYGELKPIETNDTIVGKASNRRVVAVLQK
ncbi:OmpA family protein [Poseidonibacter lekithochrous]|uniref:OmpA family protein n=1 Tax=Poseidonibacter lekithochrous TaxID=1904463 RepID=UPI0008FC7C46|nr:OmpA family protein [Poseidonibacter lekithochrous]QKJ21812.1 OmpA domain-containing protein [Poseidonibacter lekithochrous]